MKITNETVALVTGASRGLGYATALELARQGAHVLALARTVGGLEELADQIDDLPGSVTLVPMDITDENALRQLCRSIYNRWGKLDILIHCAIHAAPLSPVAHISEKDFDRCWQVNTRATQRLIALIEPLMKHQNATAIFIDDDNIGEKFFTSYGVSKRAAQEIVAQWMIESSSFQPNIQRFSAPPMPTALRARFFPGEEKTLLNATESVAADLIRTYFQK